MTAGRFQRGAALLGLVLALLATLTLALLYASRNVLMEQGLAAQQRPLAQANEAAQAGIAWALAQLNGGAIDGACQPGESPDHLGFRERQLQAVLPTDPWSPLAAPAQAPAECALSAPLRWQCRCATDAPALPSRPQAAFSLRISAVPGGQGLLRLQARGCSAALARCDDLPTRVQERVGRDEISQDVALLPALRSWPAAPLTCAGPVDSGGALALGRLAGAPPGPLLHSAALAVQGEVLGLAGTPAPSATLPPLALGDTQLQPGRLFSQLFGMGPARYAGQPAAFVLHCAPEDCRAALDRALAGGHRLLVAHGTVRLQQGGPMDSPLGSPERPLLLVVLGRLELEGALQVHGLLHASEGLRWHNPYPWRSGRVQGAVVSEGECAVAGPGLVELVYDAAVLQRLSRQAGSYVKAPGGWAQPP